MTKNGYITIITSAKLFTALMTQLMQNKVILQHNSASLAFMKVVNKYLTNSYRMFYLTVRILYVLLLLITSCFDQWHTAWQFKN